MSARKSLRIAEQRVAAITAAQGRQATVALEPRRIMTRPQKKRKVVSHAERAPTAPVQDDFRKIKGRRGALKTMTEMPIDILLEIFSQLQPVDLLHVSRSTKALRDIVLGSNAKFLWEQAYKNVPAAEKPPPCPPGMNLLHYTNLLYGRHCHFCASTPARIVHWFARIRLCTKCAPKQLILQAKTGDLYPMCSAMYFKSSNALYAGVYIAKADFDQHVLGYNKLQNENHKARYKKKAEEESRTRINHGQRLQAWERNMKNARDSNTRSVRDARRRAIMQKIREEGYGAELSRLRIDNLPGVNLAKAFSDKEWERIRRNIIPILEYQRQETKRQQLIRDYQWRIRSLSNKVQLTMSKILKPPLFPPFSHYARAEPFCNLIKDESIPTRDLVQRTNEHILEIPKIAASWKVETDRFLRKLLKKSKVVPKSNVEPLDLAITFFKCSSCNDPITYPRILMHACLRDQPYAKDEDENQEANVEEAVSQREDEDEEEIGEDNAEKTPSKDADGEVIPVTPESVWSELSYWYGSTWNESGDQVFVDEEAVGFAKTIVKACGEDPATMTFVAMEEKDARLECVRCTAKAKQKTRNRLVMNWKMAILHDLDIHFEEEPSEAGWKLLTDDDDLAKVKETELKLSVKWKKPVCVCVHCPDRLPRDNFHIERHVAGWHREVKRGDDPLEVWAEQQIYPLLDIPMRMPPHPVKI